MKKHVFLPVAALILILIALTPQDVIAQFTDAHSIWNHFIPPPTASENGKTITYVSATKRFQWSSISGGAGCVTAGSVNQVLTDDGAGGCASNANWTLTTTTLAPGASGILDLHLAGTTAFKVPGGFTTGVLHVTTTTGATAGGLVVTADITDANVTAAKMVNAGVFTGDVTTTFPAITVARVNGITYSATAAAHSVEVITTANTTATAKVIPDCTDTGGNHLNFTQSTDAFSCGTSGGGTSVTTKGDLQGFSTVAARIPVGTDGQVLTADSAQALGVKWSAAGSGTPCTTTALSIQFNNAGAFGCVAEFIYTSSTISASSSGIVNLSAGKLVLPTTNTAGSGITISTVSGTSQISFDSSVLAGVYASLAGPNTFTAGGTLIISDSATTEGLRLVGGSRPSAPTAGALHISATGAFEWYTGSVWSTAGTATGTVSSIATTSPITGGTITTTGTIACATCVVASSPGAGIAHFAGSTQTVTSSLIVNADITAATITAAKLAATTFDAQTDAATITWAIASVLNAQATVTLGGNRTLNITNPVVGGNYVFKITQDGTGSRTLTKGTGCTWKELGSSAATFGLSTSASAIDILSFTYDGTNCYANVGKDYK